MTEPASAGRDPVARPAGRPVSLGRQNEASLCSRPRELSRRAGACRCGPSELGSAVPVGRARARPPRRHGPSTPASHPSSPGCGRAARPDLSDGLSCALRRELRNARGRSTGQGVERRRAASYRTRAPARPDAGTRCHGSGVGPAAGLDEGMSLGRTRCFLRRDTKFGEMVGTERECQGYVSGIATIGDEDPADT
jgi:hypothetical protein